MIIPSIDLMDGKAVQLRQGKDHVLTSDRDPVELAQEFNRYGEIAVIDLDAALGKGDNLDLVRRICQVADVRAGGGIRDVTRAKALLRAGAQRIIIGTAATPDFLGQLPTERVMVALDHRHGQVVDAGWTHDAGEALADRALRLAPHCSAFLCTDVTHEGTLDGVDVKALVTLQASLPRPVTVAGGIATTEEVIQLSQAGLDVQVGMALYTGKLDLAQSIVGAVDFEKMPQIPTVVQDTAGQVLMLAYSTPESLALALQKGQGIYYSRSRGEIWHKGETSGHTQTLVSCRVDCDRDTLLFTVKQDGPACHNNTYSCFGRATTPKFSLANLYDLLAQRKREMPAGSYTAKLLADRKLLLRKIMEEAFEVCTAENQDETAWEIADVIYHMSVLAVDEGLDWHRIETELGGRHG